MRHVILVLMIALLPLRGWVGDAMAMELIPARMVAHALQADESMPAPAHHGAMGAAGMAAPPPMHADCPGHAGAPDEAQPKAADCSTCTACQICHAVALTPFFPHLAPAPLPANRPLAATHHFASAERAPGFKPPIS